MKSQLKRALRKVGLDLVRYHELDELELVRKRVLRSCTTAVDVGANHGQWAFRLRECGWAGPIISFEPIESIARALSEAVRGDKLWSVYATALGAVNATQVIHIAANEGGASSLLSMNDRVHEVDSTASVIGSASITVQRLDQIGCLSSQDYIFLKADVQGYELEVLRGSAGLTSQIVAMELEISLIPLYQSQPTIDAMFAECRAMGFTPIQIRNGFIDPKNGQLLQVDVLFIQDDYLDNY